MPRITQLITVTIAEEKTIDETRAWSIRAEANKKLFLLPEMLAEQGVIQKLEPCLRRAVRDTVARYIRSSKDVFKGNKIKKMIRESAV